MNNSAAFKNLIIYAICVPLALVIGYIVAMAAYAPSFSSFGVFGLLILVLSIPIFLRWHHLLLIGGWNFIITLFFLPGRPTLWLAMVAISLGISLLQRTLSWERRFISAPEITWPLVCMTGVIFFTAKLTGGIGLQVLGSDVWGGKKYIFLFAGIFSYFALTARRIPPEKANLYVALFFLGYASLIVGDLVSVLPSGLSFIFLLFPPSGYAFAEGAQRLGGVANFAAAAFALMLARYGVRGIFLAGKFWRPVLFGAIFVLALFGGFRSIVISCVLVFTFQFFLQGAHRTKLLPVFFFFGICAAVAVVPLSDKLPRTFQRALAFLPVKIDPVIQRDADSSAEWRWEMVRAVTPQIPQYLFLGKGYALSESEMQSVSQAFHAVSAEDWAGTVAGDYHNGPLSVIIPFGIWGVIAFGWFQIASILALYRNYQYGDPNLKNINALLFSAFLTHTLIFWSPIFGALSSDMPSFAGVIGLGVSLNGGVAKVPAKNRPNPLLDKRTLPVFVRRPMRPA